MGNINDILERKKEIMKRNFFRYLKNENVFYKFLYNFKKRDKFWIKDFQNINSMPNVIDKAFIWPATKEGMDYWRDKNNDFRSQFNWK